MMKIFFSTTKTTVPLPPLEMVDDVLGVQKCGTKSVNLNGAINTFMEAEKLTIKYTLVKVWKTVQLLKYTMKP